MSYEDFHKPAHDVLIDVIDHNVQTQPRPHHCNKDLMTAALQMEVHHGTSSRPE